VEGEVEEVEMTREILVDVEVPQPPEADGH